MKKTAILLGASGLTGNLLLDQLIADDRYDSIKVFTRKSLGKKTPKVHEFVGNLLNLEQFRKDFKGHDVFCCIGTTAKKTSDKALYHEIDFGIPVAAAQLCVENKIDTYLVISAMGANARSRIFYSRTKGEMEQAVLAKKIPNTYILRPSFIDGNREEHRSGEKMGMFIAKFIQPMMVGRLKKYRFIKAETIARAMIYLANKKLATTVILSDRIETFGSV
ncbi:MAG: NAD(P)H-binding protein [Bacteroidales bacterium]